jgi:hypothetical protein
MSLEIASASIDTMTEDCEQSFLYLNGSFLGRIPEPVKRSKS